MGQFGYDAIIIGAGHNGLVCASYLAQAGLSVVVLERLDRTGGAIVGESIHPGFKVPYCPYVCHMFQGKVIEELDLIRHGYGTYRYDHASSPSRRVVADSWQTTIRHKRAPTASGA